LRAEQLCEILPTAVCRYSTIHHPNLLGTSHRLFASQQFDG